MVKHHTSNIGAMSMKLAELAGLSESEANILRLASPLHDVGKTLIPEGILNKPGKLTDEEFEVMKTHAQIGYEILATSSRTVMKAAAIVAQQHHERWDGSGYPQGLSGERIHVFARIVAIVDVFDALLSDRVYRPAMGLEKVLEILQNGRGSHFQPDMLDLFLENIDTFLGIQEQSGDPVNDLTEIQPDGHEISPEILVAH